MKKKLKDLDCIFGNKEEFGETTKTMHYFKICHEKRSHIQPKLQFNTT